MKLTEFRSASAIPAPVYFEKPYVILNTENVILFAGTAEQVRKQSSYFDACRVDVRRHDLHMNDNSRRPTFAR